MKNIYLLFILSVMLIGCTGKTNQTTAGKDLSTSSPEPGEIQPQNSPEVIKTANIVHPLIPDRVIRVGGSKADIQGYTSGAIQLAIDAIHQAGGGTVQLMPGNYEVIAPVRLYSNTALVGSGPSTILKKCKGFSTAFTVDADYGELKIRVADPSGFVPGMGIQIYDSDNAQGWDVTTAVITAMKDSVLYIDHYLVRDYRADRGGTVSNACSVVSAVEAENVTISNLSIEGGRSLGNEGINGCRGGAVYLHKVNTALVENIIVKDFATDGISWQITEHVTLKNCEISGCAGAGIHPGTGSPFTLIEGNNSFNNDGYGLFVCWRVQHGTVRNNRFHHNGKNGICTGHKDSDMLFENNHIFENGADGVNLRFENESNAPHRNTFRNNLVENNGIKTKGYGFSFNSPATQVILEKNNIRNSGNGKQLAAIFYYKNSLPVQMVDNLISGHPEGEVVKEE